MQCHWFLFFLSFEKRLTTLVRWQLNIVTTMTTLMGPYYEWLRVSTEWLTKRGVDPSAASKYVGGLFNSIAQDAKEAAVRPSGFDELVAEQTPVRVFPL